MEDKHICKQCGKPVEYDKDHKRWKTFCSMECQSKYNHKPLKEHKCPVCGKDASYNEKIKKYNSTCGNKECIKTLQQMAQAKGHIGKVKFQITKEELYKLFIIENKTREELAKYYNCSLGNIKKKLSEFNISKPSKLSNKNTLKTKNAMKEALN